MSARGQRIVRWVMDGADNDRYLHEEEVYWGVFVVDATDLSPLAMFRSEEDANQHARLLAHGPENNTEYDVSPCVVDIAHRDNFEVPK